MYSFDTGHFYSNHEKYLHDRNCCCRREGSNLKLQLTELEKTLLEMGYSKKALHLLKKKCKSCKALDMDTDAGSDRILIQYTRLCALIAHKRDIAKQSKDRLSALLKNRVKQNEMSDGRDHIRCIRNEALHDGNVISVFESFLTRTLEIEANERTDAMIVVQVYYFDIFRDLCFYGFSHNGEKYRYFTSSAGQIRTKKAVFIRVRDFARVEKTIMCGLTLEKINAMGGNNVNKHLAYMALSNSATDEWADFDINRSIVVDDFETQVFGTCDYIDDSDYSITQMARSIPITHTDGAGMVLPSLLTKNAMFRAPWMKGLLGVFDFRRFLEETDCPPVLKDIYGKEHDIIEENIQIIFTKSQFKMYRYYSSWDEYKDFYKTHRCFAGLCNMEEERIKYAKINYQMLQTLTNITTDEIDLLTQKSADRIRNLCTSQDSMMQMLGITPYNTRMTGLQKAIKLYPSLLSDAYVKDTLRSAKDSLLKKYRSGKLEITGKYTFILPDFYAACEFWFLHNEKPKGLLNDQEVYCRLFPRAGKVDCLRSPHLYREHAVRQNLAGSTGDTRILPIKKWFITDAIYTSTHDLISKLLQFDVDGDRAFVVADPDFVRIAERNMQGIVPLYYNMQKANPQRLCAENIYQGLIAAFTGAPIGTDSNDISKIWNSKVFITGTENEREEAMTCIKLLCMENNFHIDYAKTLYKPTRPDGINALIQRHTKSRLPAFFAYAKDKEVSQLEEPNESFVNQIHGRIPNLPIRTKDLALSGIDHHLLMDCPNMVCSREVLELYHVLNKKYRYMIHMKDEHSDNLRYVSQRIQEQFSALGYSDTSITDMLVQYLYGSQKRYKQLLWFCYGSYIAANLEKNTDTKKTKYVQCIDCCEWFEVGVKNSKTCRCPVCTKEHRKQYQRNIMRERTRLA